jgi:hypothetical protein
VIMVLFEYLLEFAGIVLYEKRYHVILVPSDSHKAYVKPIAATW